MQIIISENLTEIDKKLYQKMIYNYIYEHYYYKDYEKLQKQDRWKIEIKATSEYDTSFYSSDPRAEELDFSIPHGVTGNGDLICYITNSGNNLVMLQNMSVIIHELAHMILMVYYPNKIVKMRHNDFHGRAGDNRKFFSSEVHDRVTEGNIRTITYPISRWRKIRYVGVDISDITNGRNIKKV